MITFKRNCFALRAVDEVTAGCIWTKWLIINWTHSILIFDAKVKFTSVVKSKLPSLWSSFEICLNPIQYGGKRN
ncbi:MAG: hypothetical protein ACTS44_01490 [Candidatus Hodgkinia cicadicola]